MVTGHYIPFAPIGLKKCWKKKKKIKDRPKVHKTR